MSDWQRFKVGKPSETNNWTNPDCVQINMVHHVSHIDQAVDILRDNQIAAGLVFDESILKQSRTQVVWLSPNTWIDGSRYGNVQFTFEFPELVLDKNYYWVEVMEKYNPPACRILITDKKYKDLSAYDPKAHDGPWWYEPESNKHYWNNNYCLEFMFEKDVTIELVQKIDFIDHHGRWCARHRASQIQCAELGESKRQGAAKFLATLLSRNIKYPRQLLDSVSSISELPDSLGDAICLLSLTIAPRALALNEAIPPDDPVYRLSVARAICNAFANGLKDENNKLLKLMGTKDIFHESLLALIRQHFSLRDDK